MKNLDKVGLLEDKETDHLDNVVQVRFLGFSLTFGDHIFKYKKMNSSNIADELEKTSKGSSFGKNAKSKRIIECTSFYWSAS